MILWAAAETTEAALRWALRATAAQDRAHAARYRHPRPRGQSLLARALLRRLLVAATGLDGWSVRADSQGKPFAQMPGGVRGPAISLTHSGGLAVCALSLGPERRLGIDLEQIRPRDCAALAARAFGPGESTAVASGGAEMFYNIWTLREAWSKADGAGLRQAADGRDRISRPGGSGPVRQGGWNLWQGCLHAGSARYSLAFAAESPAGWRREDLRRLDVDGVFLTAVASRRLTSPVWRV